MSSTFTTLNIADSSLNASVAGMSIASNNISNAQTPGYARETVNQTNSPSIQEFTDQYTYMGQGVDAENAQRQTDEYVNQEYRSNNSQYQYWNSMNTELSNVQGVFNEPSGTSVRTAMDSFFSSWNQLSQNPNDEGVRSAVLESSQNLVTAFSTLNQTLTGDSAMYNNEVSQGVTEVNTLATNISELNSQIQTAQQTGDAPNSLEDQRDALLNQLSQYMNINVSYSTPAGSNVTNMTVTYNTVNSATGTVTTNTLINNGTTNTLTTADVQNFQSNQAGTLSAYNTLATYSTNVATEMNNLLGGIAQDVNSQQESGYEADGTTSGKNNPLFDISTDANGNTSSVTVDPNATPDTLAAASTSGSQTDGSNALAIANLATQKNYDSKYAGYVAQIGDDVASANNEQQTYNNLTTQVQNTQNSISGVDINQEMSNIIQYQQTYNASSKLISIFSDMLNTMIQNS